MSSGLILTNPNDAAVTSADIIAAFSNPETLAILQLIYKRGPIDSKSLAGALKLDVKHIRSLLASLVKSKVLKKSGRLFVLSDVASRRLDLTSFSLDFIVGTTIEANSIGVENPIRNDYLVESLIGRGATSFTFNAIQSSTHRRRALKIFLPNIVTYADLNDAILKRRSIESEAFPDLVDVGEVQLILPNGSSLVVQCVVYDFVASATTFTQYLFQQDNPNRKILERFIERVGGALAAIESEGLAHGDLHEGNILVVDKGSGNVEFWVIDFIGVPKIRSAGLETASDIQNFRDQLLRAAIIFGERYHGYSARNFLGERVARILTGLRGGKYRSFAELLNDYEQPATVIPTNHFDEPKRQPFDWLRVEFIPKADMLFKLFQPFQKRFEILNRFGNNWVSGPRGSGKSHYLRVLAFHPQTIVEAENDSQLAQKFSQLNYNFRNAFGVLFACRLGEFKMFSPQALTSGVFDLNTQNFLKHILVLKIWNKTLNAIRNGLETTNTEGQPLMVCPDDFDRMIDFLEERIGSLSIVESLKPLSVFYQACLTCTARENSDISVWHIPSRRHTFKLLDETDLDAFFGMLRETFSDLSNTRFFILVDDASDGQVHFELQKVLNSLVRSIQANHCFKITFDKYMYTLDTADGRSLDTNNEGTYIDLGETVSPTHRGKRDELSDYMAEVIDLRLKEAGYKSGIHALLGTSQSVNDFLSALSIPGSRRPKRNTISIRKEPRKKAYYGGWNIVWSISHGSIRTLLELIEHIFKHNNVDENTDSIPLNLQDIAVRNYSNSRNKQILMLPGVYEDEPLGDHLQAVLAAIGEVSRQYLENYDTGDATRWYETISFERNDRKKLSKSASLVLHELVKNGYVLDDGTTFARAQFGLEKRYDMNKIFAPAFLTTYRVRNHIYLGHDRLEELLLRPVEFVGRHKKKLKELVADSVPSISGPLFESNEEQA